MPRTKVLNAVGEEGDGIELSERLFAAPINQPLIHQAVLWQLAGRHAGTADTKTRGEVSGGGAKPWRQKGTGRARQGSRRSPQWAGGGVVFGPHPGGHRPRLPSKMRRAALRGVLSAKQAEGALRIVDGFELAEIGTRHIIGRLDAWKAGGKVLLVLADRDEVVERSAANLREVRIVRADSLNVVDLVEADTIVFTRGALERAEAVYA